MSFRLSHLLAALLGTLLALVVTTPAFAWVDMHLLSVESRIELKRDGGAHVQHNIKLRVAGGPLRTLDFGISDRQIALSGDATFATASDGLTPKMPIPVVIDQRPDGDVRIEIDEKRGVKRGVYELQFGYDVDLLQAGAIVRDGSMLKLTWMGPRWQDGLDNVRCTIAIPASATEPRPALESRTDGREETGAGPVGSYLTTMTRLPEFDEVTLIRPHVARDESVPWAVRVDPSALGEVNDPRLHPPTAIPATQPMAPTQRAVVLAIGGAIALAFSIVLALKHSHVAASSKERGVEPRPLVPIGPLARILLAGPVLVAGLAGQAFLSDPLPGSLGVLGAVALAAYRTPIARSRPRGPGRWLAFTDVQAFGSPTWSSPGWLDFSTTLGKVVWLIATAAFGTAVWLVSRTSLVHAHLAALDYVVIATVFCTGHRRQLPADAVLTAAPLLQRLARELRASKSLATAKIKAIGRVPTAARRADELRLTVNPNTSLAGFLALEVGIAWEQGLAGPMPMYQALLRVTEGSACHEAISRRTRGVRWTPGRNTSERVVTLSPTLPTLAHIEQLVEDTVKTVHASNAPKSKPSAAPKKTPARRQPPASASSSARNSSGTPSRTSKAGTLGLPFQDTW